MSDPQIGTRPASTRRRDQIFAGARRASDFDFGRETAEVFDDMLERSVPFYTEMQSMVADLAVDFAAEGSSLYDLGCSTCTSFLAVDDVLPRDLDLRFVGVDSSPEMLELGRKRLEEARFARPFELRHADLNQGVEVANASVVLMLLTLQFVRPLYRDTLVRGIHAGMRDQGCLILIEKVLGESSLFNRLFIKHYYDLKRRNGYTELEIAQKREALENVLVPYRIAENQELLRRAGFSQVDIFFKWYNFCGIIATK